MSDEPVKTIRCPNCNLDHDARAPYCYLCKQAADDVAPSFSPNRALRRRALRAKVAR